MDSTHPILVEATVLEATPEQMAGLREQEVVVVELDHVEVEAGEDRMLGDIRASNRPIAEGSVTEAEVSRRPHVRPTTPHHPALRPFRGCSSI